MQSPTTPYGACMLPLVAEDPLDLVQVLDRGSLLSILTRLPDLGGSATLRPPKHVMVCGMNSVAVYCLPVHLHRRVGGGE
jgi:hypothetical protein